MDDYLGKLVYRAVLVRHRSLILVSSIIRILKIVNLFLQDWFAVDSQLPCKNPKPHRVNFSPPIFICSCLRNANQN